MRLVLMACIFFTGVYFGLSAEPEGGLFQMYNQVQGLIYGEPEW